VGEHEIRIIGDFEEVTISHRAFSRSLFASGALVLAKWLRGQKPGFYGLLDVSLEDLIPAK
jgi:4-hydroxy-tetrahydrodipicolinate reductase